MFCRVEEVFFYLLMDSLDKSAGQSVRQPLQDGKYFEPQAKVDNFVDQYPRPLCSQQQVMVLSNVKCITGVTVPFLYFRIVMIFLLVIL